MVYDVSTPTNSLWTCRIELGSGLSAAFRSGNLIFLFLYPVLLWHSNQSNLPHYYGNTNDTGLTLLPTASVLVVNNA